MLLKASTITNLTDARYFAAKEVDFLGFCLEEGAEGYLDPIYMKAMREWVEGPKIVGEFDQTPARTVFEAARFFELDAVQVRRTDDLNVLDGLEVLLALPAVSTPETLLPILEKAAPYVRYFLLDFSSIVNAEAILENQLAAWKNLFARFPTLLDIQIAHEALPGLLNSLQPAGLALQGGDEERVGVKSFDEIDLIFDAL